MDLIIFAMTCISKMTLKTTLKTKEFVDLLDFLLLDKNKKDGELRSLQPIYKVQTCEVCQ